MRRNRPWYLWLLGGVLWAVVIGIVLWIAFPFAAVAYGRPRVACVLCGAREMQTRYGPITLSREPMESVGAGWWDEIAPPGHSHEWHTFGCVQGFRRVSCTMIYEPDIFLGTLPRFRDQDLAHAIAKRLVSMEPEARWREERDSQVLSGIGLLVSQGERGEPSDDLAPAMQIQLDTTIARDYAKWREDHPVWHDLFQPTLDEIEAGR